MLKDIVDLDLTDSVISDMDYAKKCKALRIKMKLSQSEMATKLGYSSAIRISEVENGNKEMSNQAKMCMLYLEMLFKNKLIE